MYIQHMKPDYVDIRAAGRELVEQCLALRLRKVTRVATRIYDDELRSLGPTVNQLAVLAILAAREAALPSDLCRILDMERSTVTRTANRMVRNGWIEDCDAQPVE